MFDPNNSNREQRRYYRYRNQMRGLGTGFFLLVLFIAFLVNQNFSGIGFLPILFAGLALISLFGGTSSMRRYGVYGGLNGFIWLLGLAICFQIGFWPWILLPVALTLIAGAIFNPFTMGSFAARNQANAQRQEQPPYQQPLPQEETPAYQPYQQGYQPPYPSNYQEPAPKQEYEQPLIQYPEQQQQQLPPMQQ